ncbi:Ras-related protein Rab-3C [Plecturocebus cupreus]
MEDERVISAERGQHLGEQLETESRYITQADLELLGLSNPPTSASQTGRQSPRLECSGGIAHCSLCLPDSSNSPSDPPTSASRVAGITGTQHHTRLIFVYFGEVGSRYVAQVGLELLSSSDPPTLASQSAEITGMSRGTQPILQVVLMWVKPQSYEARVIHPRGLRKCWDYKCETPRLASRTFYIYNSRILYRRFEFFETSAKDNINVKQTFERLVDIICDKMSEGLETDPAITAAKQNTRLKETPPPPQPNCAC